MSDNIDFCNYHDDGVDDDYDDYHADGRVVLALMVSTLMLMERYL